MLILTRQEGESVRIMLSDEIDPQMSVQELFGEKGIQITLTSIQTTQQARLGFEAPQALCIVREELCEQTNDAPGP